MSAPLTPAGEVAVADLAQRYRVSDGAVRNLLDAVIRGGGAMAQFSHPDLGGSGQWMRGGMTMVGDLFNSGLQATVSGICSELSALMASGTALVMVPDRTASPAFGSFGGDWWPAELGRPSSSGGQNDAAYAYFPGPRRLAIRSGGAVTLFDTGDHSISGVQQQQGGRGSLEFSSQLGTFTVDSLPVVETGVEPAVPPMPVAQHQPPPAAHPAPAAPPVPATHPPAPSTVPPAPLAAVAVAAGAGAASTPAEIGAAIETLADLRDKGFLTDDEFTAKKTELIGRL